MTMKIFTVKILLIDMQLDCEDMCLAQFAASYTYNRNISQDENEFAHELDLDIPDNSDEITHTNVTKLQNGLGQMKKRKRKAVIRWHNFNIEKEPEKHYRSHIMLFLPWRREITGQLHVI